MKVYAGNPPLTIGNSIAGAIEIETPEHITRNDLKLSLSLANAGILISKRYRIKISCNYMLITNFQLHTSG